MGSNTTLACVRVGQEQEQTWGDQGGGAHRILRDGGWDLGGGSGGERMALRHEVRRSDGRNKRPGRQREAEDDQTRVLLSWMSIDFLAYFLDRKQ